MDPELAVLAFSLFVCVALSSFFSASETAYMALNRVRLKTMVGTGNRKAELALELTEDYDPLLTTVLIGNNIVNIAGTVLATVFFTRLFGSRGATVSTIVMTILILVVGEVTPKTLAKRSPEQFAIRVARIMKVLIRVLTPCNLLFRGWRQLLDRIVPASEESTDIEDEIMTMVNEAQHEGDMDAHEGDLIRSAIEFRDSDALDIMTPRVDVEALEDTASMEEAEELFLRSGYSRIPVFHEDMDHVIGVLHEKDFYRAKHAGVQSIQGISMPPVYASATQKVSKLLNLFQQTRTHMVIVLDEFGGTEGIVTMEDVLEELVGEIFDEHDDISEDIAEKEDGTLIVNGLVPLEDLYESLNLPCHYASDTVGGWAAEVIGRIPEVGTKFSVDGLDGEVIGMERLRVTQVQVRRQQAKPDENTGH